ncbi:MAG: hypothetical protein KDA84_18220 [Planctomycetaceae bacterium]|nr:hypothetical protein [Planctomycetaceae bacterium]
MNGVLVLIAAMAVGAGEIKVHEPTGRVTLSAGADDATMKQIPGEARILFMLSATNVSGEGLKELARLQDLSFFRLNRTAHGDAALEALVDHRKLRKLMMWSDTGITSDGVKHLATVKSLESLDFTDVPLDAEALKAFPTQVESLTLQGCQVGDKGLAMLPHFPRLKGLKIKDDDQVTEAGLIAFVNRHPQLEWLAVDVTSDRFLTSLTKLPNLKSLWLSGEPISSKGVKSIGHLQKLDRLTLSFEINEELKARIQKLPNEKLNHVSHQGRYIYLDRRAGLR